jgi:hypothetical protein
MLEAKRFRRLERVQRENAAMQARVVRTVVRQLRTWALLREHE